MMNLTCAPLLAAALALLSATVSASPTLIDTEIKDSSRDRSIPLKVRLPAGTQKSPLVIFSHGLGGSVDGGKVWGEHWAENGYLVVHIQHPGSDVQAMREALAANSGPAANRLRNIATAENLIGRVDDVRFLIAEIDREQRLGTTAWMNRADLSRIAMTGHSFGAHTTMSLAGQRYPGPVKSLAEPKIKAFIAFSPNASGQAKTFDERFGGITAPVLSITGTRDGDPFANDRNPKRAVERRIAVYEHQPAGDKFLLVLNDADHMVFNGNPQQSLRGFLDGDSTPNAAVTGINEAVKAASTKFLDAYLRGNASAKTWLTENAKTTLADKGEWRHK